MGNSSGKEEGQQAQTQHNPRQSPPEQFQRSPRLSASPRPPVLSPSSNPSKASTTSTMPSSTLSSTAVVSKPPVLDLTNTDDPVVYLDKLFGDNGIPVVFRWDKGGDEAYVTGTFDEWNVKIPMSQSGNDFVHIRNLQRGKHGYKFVVDNQWEFNKDQHSMVEANGNIINFVDLTEFKPKFENLPDLNLQVQQSARFISEASDLMYGNRIPDINDYTKEPPALPQHLRSIILNSKSGVPQHDQPTLASTLVPTSVPPIQFLIPSAAPGHFSQLGVIVGTTIGALLLPGRRCRRVHSPQKQAARRPSQAGELHTNNPNWQV
ncbi:hypothetical protein BASA81_004449 [Batrachochytrium salamandrivorans]|nr:hypothetical protein BASA81_004449 [Batrachochytrium salamandrivorans]